jgi:hypothetical protein
VTERLYVRIRSWHIASFMDRGGALRTLCGRRARVEGTITSGPGGHVEHVSPTATALPFREKTCESCLRSALKAEEVTRLMGGSTRLGSDA